MENVNGKCYVLGDHINTDQILVAEYMKYNPSIPEEYEKLGSLAMSGLSKEYSSFIGENGKSKYNVIVAGENFGCGSSREHAVKALEASGVRLILAKSFARIFYRNCLNTGKILVLESKHIVLNEFTTDDIVSFDLNKNLVVNQRSGMKYQFSPLMKEVEAIFNSGGIFNYARKVKKI